MAAAVVIAPASGSITNQVTACEITCTGVAANTLTGYDATKYPASPEVTYYFKLAATGQDNLRSQVFSPSEAGAAEWHSVIFPAAGTWTLTANKVSDDSVTATASVTVA